MPAYIHHIATLVPEFSYEQRLICQRMTGWARSSRSRRIIKKVYDCSGIAKRHSVCPDFQHDEGGALFRTLEDGSLQAPGTLERNAVYASASRDLSVRLARRALEECERFSAREITHVIFASCTGFANPGPDYHIVRELGLRPSVERYTIGFMGCYAAFPALRMAATICEANPSAVVLVMCLELCTLHLNVSDQPDSIVANSIFGDGAACAVVSAHQPNPGRAAYRLDGFHTALVPATETHMAWEIGNQGFNMVLSSYVPELIGGNVQGLVEEMLRRRGRSLNEIKGWAVHPGGRAILDHVQANLVLDDGALFAARKVLREHGNMSSATVLFVLQEMLRAPSVPGALTVAMAFGPGLTVEMATLVSVGSPPQPTPALRDRHHLMMEAMSI